LAVIFKNKEFYKANKFISYMIIGIMIGENNMSKISEAQKKASRAYENRNRDKTRINTYRRTARLFVKSYATEEDMRELIKIFNENKKID